MGTIKTRSLKLAFAASLFISLLAPVLTPALKIFAAGETLSNVSTITAGPDTDVVITGLQINGTGDDEVQVSLYVPSGELWFDNYSDVTFEGSDWGTNIKFSGLRSDVNDALANLRYWNEDEGTYTVEVLLGGGDLNPENEHVYLVVSASGITWADAEEAASEMTYGGAEGYLATITSQEEYDFIRERIDDSGWIGANDIASEGVWRWVTGPEAGTQFWAGAEDGSVFGGAYANWNTGEPNNSTSGENDEDCGQIYFTEESDGQWNDLDCESDENEYYVVEFGGNTEESLPAVEATTFDIVLARETEEVSSCDEMFELTENDAADNIELTADIDCGGRTEEPLIDGDDYMGVFDGNGFTIKNLTLANEYRDHVGLFGNSDGAEFYDLYLENITVESGYHSGTLVGHVDEGIVLNNIHARNITMNADSGDDSIDAVGGLIGTTDFDGDSSATIESVSFEGTINILSSGAYAIGGIGGNVDVEHDLTIEQVYADVDIVASEGVEDVEDVGGLFGYLAMYDDGYDYESLTLRLRDVYSWGSIAVPNAQDVGGLVGNAYVGSENYYDMSYVIDNAYSWMDIVGGDDVGGLIGFAENGYGEFDYEIEIANSFFAGSLVGEAEETTGALIGTYAEVDGQLVIDNDYFDETAAGTDVCVGNFEAEDCTAVNADGNDGDYFINNSSNAPMDGWDFEDIWVANSGIPPTFRGLPYSDDDNDGANNGEEQQAPNNGDANNDGIDDNEQPNVASFSSPVTNQYVSVAVNDECTVSGVGAQSEAAKVAQDSGYNYPDGLVNFSAECASTSVSVYFYGADAGLVIRKFNPNTNAYFTISSATQSTQTIGGQTVIVVSYELTDGGALDTDGQVNGVIVDPVGLGALGTGSPNTGLGSMRSLLFVKN